MNDVAQIILAIGGLVFLCYAGSALSDYVTYLITKK